jgi:hypothetical protein
MVKRGFLLIGLAFICCIISVNESFAQIKFEKGIKLTTTSSFIGVLVTDINNDGLDDIIGATSYYWGQTEEDAKIYIYLQDPVNGFKRDIVIDYPEQYAGLYSFSSADLNNDGYKDIVISYSDSIGIFYQKGNNQFGECVSYYSGSASDEVICKDVNGDSFIDIIAKNLNSPNSLYIFQNEGSGFSLKKYNNENSLQFEYLEMEDFNNDDNLDALYSYPGQTEGYNTFISFYDSLKGYSRNDIKLRFNDEIGSGRFSDLKAADYDNDGDFDIIGLGLEYLTIWKNNNLDFSDTVHVRTNEYAVRLSVEDFNCDNKNDIIVMAGFSVSVHEPVSEIDRFNTYWVSEQYSSPTPWANQFSTGDLNNDGLKDIAISYLDGIVIMENKSVPTYFNDIDTIINRRKTIVDAGLYEYYFGEYKLMDSTVNGYIYQVDSFKVSIDYEESYTDIDTIFNRRGVFCRGEYSDIVYTDTLREYNYYSEQDTVVIFSKLVKVPVKSKRNMNLITDVKLEIGYGGNELRVYFTEKPEGGLFRYQIFDIYGNLMMKGYENMDFNFNDFYTIEINELMRGPYILYIKAGIEGGDYSISRKFIKK